MNIAFTYNVRKNLEYSLQADQSDIEFDPISVVDDIVSKIEQLGHSVIKIEADLDAYENLKKHKNEIDLVFNIAEGLGGDARESQIPLFCEMLGIPYTFSSPTTHAIKIHKHYAKEILANNGICAPRSKVVNKTNYSTADYSGLTFPVIIKPNTQGSSKGIYNDSVATKPEQVIEKVERVLNEFDFEAIVEEYVDGREFTVTIIGNPFRVLPILEQKFDHLPKGFNRVAGYELKWIYEDTAADNDKYYSCPAKVSPEIKKEVEETSLKIAELLDVRDAARIDYRLNDSNKLYFLEINTLPGLNPDPDAISCLVYTAEKAGLKFTEVLTLIINSAVSRYPQLKNK